MSDPDPGPVVKSLQSYHAAKAYGASDGTMAGNLGVEDRRREQEKMRKPASNSWWQPEPKKKTAKKEDEKVICTELVRQGLFERGDYLAGARYVERHLTDQHMRGYHAWALPVVRHMRRSRRATAFWRALAQARADHVAYLNGATARRNRFGALLCAIGHPACYLIGGLASEQDWHSLYRDDTAAHQR